MMENCENNPCAKSECRVSCEDEKCENECRSMKECSGQRECYGGNECMAEKDCYSDEECEGECYGSGDGMTDSLMELGNEAWGELLKEKIKAHMEKVDGKRMDAIAEAIYEASHLYWSKKMAKASADKELEAAFGKIRSALASG